MKIEGPSSLKGSASRRRSQAESAGGDFASHFEAGSATSGGAVTGSTQLGSIDALLALQGMPDAAEQRRSPEIDRAEDLLDRLDQIRIGLLTGRLSRSTLQGIVDRLDARRRHGVDPRLANVIDEIELRARVELAKLSMI